MKFSPGKSGLSKWLFTTILVLGFFTFSGFTIPISNGLNKPDTTLATGYANRISRSVFYSAALRAANRSGCSNLTFQFLSLRVLSFLHSQEANIIIKQTSSLFISNNQIWNLFFHQKLQSWLGR